MDHRIKTARATGCVGRNAIVPRVAIELGQAMRAELPSVSQAEKGSPWWFGMLDFGCGPKFIHQGQYRDAGINVYGYDLAFEDFQTNDLPIGAVRWSTATSFARSAGYNLVLASNVINVQATEEELFLTCNDIKVAAGWQGWWGRKPCNIAEILVNYPGEPRKLGWKMKRMRDYLTDICFGVKPEMVKPGVMLFKPPERLLMGGAK